jgi:hypothetical protein
MKRMFTASVLATLMVMGGMSAASAAPQGNANGYWAGALCDSVQGGDAPYWQTRDYKNRGQCVSAEGQSLQRGEWDPEDFDLS